MSARLSWRSATVILVLLLTPLLIPPVHSAPFLRGDANADGQFDVTDAVVSLGYQFLGKPETLPCLDAADVDDSGTLDITDPVYLLEYLFLGSAPPNSPFQECGEDPTEDPLDCASFPPCQSNRPPRASFTSTLETGVAPIEVVFDASSSDDPDGTIEGYVWDFGDDESGTGLTVVHTFGVAGDYPVVLTVTDNGGATDSTTRMIRVEEADRLPGEEISPATEAIPLITYEGRVEDYRDDHPDFPGLFLSHRVILLSFTMETTVGEANELLEGIGVEIVGGLPGVATESEGVLLVRVNASDFDGCDATLESLRDNPHVLVAAPDVLLETTVCPATDVTDPVVEADWRWEDTPQGGNWGLELTRVPQMWNLNKALEKRDRWSAVGILDSGFPPHDDLVYAENQTPEIEDYHGVHVAGIIGAMFDNGVGVDGVCPFATLTVRGSKYFVSSDPYVGRASMGEMMCGELFALFEGGRQIKVINFSLGYNWHKKGVNANEDPKVHVIVNDHGRLFALSQHLWGAVGHDRPFLVTSAGNESGRGRGEQWARWANPFNNAAIDYLLSNVIVVEAVALDAAAVGGATRWEFSCTEGHLSAPGSRILSTYWNKDFPDQHNLYQALSGTSMAAPFVTGLIGYLLAVDPDLNHEQIFSLLWDNRIEVAGNASPRVDALASVLDIDRVRGNRAVLEMWLDIDDGTPDGNLRVNLEDGTEYFEEDADGDGGVGDGEIDMSDFRRWRDWVLYVERVPELNGSPDHPKKDINQDEEVELGIFENTHPRGDFNGDGKLWRDDTSYVPGAVQAEVTDLEVLQLLFEDPDYEAAELPDLVYSADLEIEVAGCFELEGESRVARVETSIWNPADDTPFQIHEYDEDATTFIHTVPALLEGEYLVRVEAFYASGEIAATEQEMFPCRLGSDARWEPFASAASLRWKFDTDQPLKTKVAVGRDGTIYVASDMLHALNPDGTEKWRYDICGLGWSAPTIDPQTDRIYIGIFAEPLRAGLRAIEPDGRESWIFHTEILGGATFFASPAIGPEYELYAPASDNYLYRIEHSGLRNWRVPLPSGGWLPKSSPALDAATMTLYVGSGGPWPSDPRYCLVAYTLGEMGASIKWAAPVDAPIRSSPAIGPTGTIYVGCDDNYFYAIDADGVRRWRFETRGDVVSSPAVGEDGTIYFGSYDKNVYALNPDGTEKWRYATERAVESSPAVSADGTVYIGSADEYLYAFYPDGRLKWRYLTNRDPQRIQALNGNTAIGPDGTVYIGSEDTYLYAVDAKPTLPGPADSAWPAMHRDLSNTQQRRIP